MLPHQLLCEDVSRHFKVASNNIDYGVGGQSRRGHMIRGVDTDGMVRLLHWAERLKDLGDK